jgi:hypothetical protein
LAQITTSSPLVQIEAEGTGSEIDLTDLTSFSNPNGNLTVGNGGTIVVAGITFSVPAAGNGITVNVPALPTSVPIDLVSTGTFTGGTTFNVPQNTTVNISEGTFTGGVIFNVAQGATVDLTGGQTITYGGTLTGSGLGTVQLSSGGIGVAVGGLTLNFAGGMFRWTGGNFLAATGDVTNLGTLNLVGSNEKGFFDDSTLDNFGTIIQTGTGNLGLHSDNISPTVLKIERGGLYELESDSGVDNPSGGQTAIVNAGVIRKTNSTGTSTILVPGPITNTGTIEADSGTLFLDATTISQVSGGTLTRGTWNAINGSSLEFPTATSITTNNADLTLSGSGATITGISTLSSNSGDFAVTGGARFSTSGDFSNSGSLTIGAGSTLAVNGNYTQTSTGALNIQIGGTPASGQFGQVVIVDSATLDGQFALALVNGFGPSSGQDFAAVTFASSSGGFASFSGLNPFFTESLDPTRLDVVDASANAVDLAATSVTAPTTATAGQPITVNWQGDDESSQAITGSWQDSVYLSATPTITSSSVLLGAVAQTGGLGAGKSYNANLTAAIPALPPGFYYVIVQVDSLYQLADANRGNNTLSASTGQIDVTVPTITPGTPYTGSFTAADQNQYFQVTVPAGGTLQIALASTAASGSTALYVSEGSLPTPYNSQESTATAGQPNQTVTVPSVLTAGTYYILAHSVSGNAATASFTLTASQTAAVTLSAPSAPYTGGNLGDVTIEIDGANFLPAVTASSPLK